MDAIEWPALPQQQLSGRGTPVHMDPNPPNTHSSMHPSRALKTVQNKQKKNGHNKLCVERIDWKVIAEASGHQNYNRDLYCVCITILHSFTQYLLDSVYCSVKSTTVRHISIKTAKYRNIFFCIGFSVTWNIYLNVCINIVAPFSILRNMRWKISLCIVSPYLYFNVEVWNIGKYKFQYCWK